MEEPRPEKVAIVDEVRERIEGAEAVMVTEYRGLTVSSLSELRRSLRPAGGSYKVYKNTLVRLAAADKGEEFNELLVGPTALAFTETTPEGEKGDVVSVAKSIKDFAKANPDMIVKGGLFEGRFIDAEGLNKLADIEPREVLLAKLAGAMAAPMTQFAGLLQALPRDFAYGLKALIDQGGAAPSSTDAAPADAPAAEAAADESPAEDAADDAAAEAAPEEEASTDAAAEAPAEEATEEDTPEADASDAESES